MGRVTGDERIWTEDANVLEMTRQRERKVQNVIITVRAARQKRDENKRNFEANETLKSRPELPVAFYEAHFNEETLLNWIAPNICSRTLIIRTICFYLAPLATILQLIIDGRDAMRV